MKRVLFIFLLSLSCFGFLHSQQLTRFAVVDLPRVYTAFFRESRAVREFEERSAGVQREIDRMTRDIQTLRTRHADAIQKDDQTEIVRIEAEISRRTDNLRNFHQTRTAQLERERANLMQSSSFLSQVHNEIKFLAESEGYTMVINLKDNPSIIWFSPSVDITDKLIQSLNSRARN